MFLILSLCLVYSWLKVYYDSTNCITIFAVKVALTYYFVNCSSKTSGKTEPFDARTIFAQYGKEEWGECYIREAHLSQRFVYDDNGYFHCCASIPFPEEKQGAFPTMKNFFQKMFS